jgi:head-tail adaptor
MLGTGELARMRATQEAALPDSCTIQEATVTQDDIGQPLKGWTAAASDVACRLARKRTRETVAGEKVTEVGDWVLTVAHDQLLTCGNRVVIGSRIFEIVGVNTGESWETATRADLVEVV